MYVCGFYPVKKKHIEKKKPNKPIFLDQNKVILYIKRVGPGIDSESGMIVAKYYSEVLRDGQSLGVEKSDKKYVEAGPATGRRVHEESSSLFARRWNKQKHKGTSVPMWRH